ncbi:MAG: hypothetical protein ABWY25_02715 [Paenisporosarcina sp.]
MALASIVQGEEYFRVALGQGMYTSELPSNIPDGFSAMAYNFVATGDSLENRIGIRRSSVDWKVFEQSPGTPTVPEVEKLNIIYHLFPTRYDSNFPAFGWGSAGALIPSGASPGSNLNFVRCAGTAGAGDGFMSVSTPSLVLGMCHYRDVVYFCLSGGGVFKITTFNWGGDAITYSSIPTANGGVFQGLFTFKDRLWAFNESMLYFTDIAPSLGYPETWAFGTNNIPFYGPNGAGRIKKIVPLGNKLLVFTMAGLYTLIVEGPPASWILRVLDSKSISTTNQCAFESKGIIYYINSAGVWATNGIYTTKVSGVIEDQFFLGKGFRTHSIVPYEDGMIISVGKLTKHTDQQYYFDAPNCRIFYTKLDPVAWTEWNIESKSTTPNVLGNRRICNVYSVSDKISTYLNPEPTAYALMFVTNSSEAVPALSTCQLLVFDGGEDQIVTEANTVLTAKVNLYLKTKNMDGGNPYNLKQNKRGLLEIFTSEQRHQFITAWEIDASTSDGQAIRRTTSTDFTVGNGSNLAQIPGMFHYRRCGLIFDADLQTNNTQIKIKDIAIVQNTERAEFEKVR